VVAYGFRSFDRQLALVDARLGDFLRPVYWQAHSDRQVYLTGLIAGVLGLGPAATISACVPDLHYFCGRGGKDVIPLWRDAEASQANLTGGLLDALRPHLGNVTAEDFFAYCYALLATPAYVETFSEELTVPGPRVPVTKDGDLFQQAVRLGRRLIWLHTYGERFVPARHRPGEVPQGRARCRRAVPDRPDRYPEEFSYNDTTRLLRVGEGEFGPVPKAVWDFSVSGLQVVHSWLRHRMKEGAGRSSSALDDIRPERWTAEISQELLELLWVLEATVAMFPELKQTLVAIIARETFRADELPQPAANERRPPGDQDDPDPPRQAELNVG
jgi:hypothetical protein